jgi:acyl dehydratase
VAATSFDPDVLAAAGFPTISYDVLVVGEEFRSDDRLVRPEDVEAYAFAVEDRDPWFFGPGPFGGPVAHPTLLANQALFLRHSRYVVPAGLHARMAFEFVRPIPLGTRARTTGRLADKYVRRGKPYMVTEYRTVDEATGDVLVQGRFVQMLFSGDTAPSPGSEPSPERRGGTDGSALPNGCDPAIASGRGRHGDLVAGQELGPVVRTVTQRQIDVYSGVKPGSIHTDDAWAQAKGLGTTIAQGMMSTAYVSTLMTDVVGEGFVRGGAMDVRFLRPVHRDDTLTVTGTVAGFTAGSDGGSTRVHVDVAARNQRAEQTLAGTASGLVA